MLLPLPPSMFVKFKIWDIFVVVVVVVGDDHYGSSDFENGAFPKN